MKAVRVWASNSYSPHSQIKKLVWLFLYTSIWGLPSPHFRRNLTDFAPLCFLILHQFTCLTLEFRKFLLLLCSPCIKFAFKIILLYFAGGIWIELLASGKSCSLWVLTNNWLFAFGPGVPWSSARFVATSFLSLFVSEDFEFSSLCTYSGKETRSSKFSRFPEDQWFEQITAFFQLILLFLSTFKYTVLSFHRSQSL